VTDGIAPRNLGFCSEPRETTIGSATDNPIPCLAATLPAIYWTWSNGTNKAYNTAWDNWCTEQVCDNDYTISNINDL